MTSNKAIKFALIGSGVILIFLLLRSLFKKQNRKEESLSPSGNFLILDLDTKRTISDIEPKQRALFGAMHDNLFETEKWVKEIPTLSFNPDWDIQPLPSSKNTVVRFKVWNKAKKEAVDVLFDPYGIMTGKVNEALWQVSAPGTKIFNIPMKDAAQLRAIIAALLQEVSPIKTDHYE